MIKNHYSGVCAFLPNLLPTDDIIILANPKTREQGEEEEEEVEEEEVVEVGSENDVQSSDYRS